MLSVQLIFSIVWLATCPRLSPVIRQLAPILSASIFAAFIMHKRSMRVV